MFENTLLNHIQRYYSITRIDAKMIEWHLRSFGHLLKAKNGTVVKLAVALEVAKRKAEGEMGRHPAQRSLQNWPASFVIMPNPLLQIQPKLRTNT